MRRCEGQETLIEAVKKRALLYSRYHPEFSDRKLKLSLWHEVCEEIIPGWKDFSVGKKGEMVCEIQKRWKTLRDGFSRELTFQRQDRMKRANGEYVRKRKIYGYYKHLKFLLKQKQKPQDIADEEEHNEEDDDQSGSDDTDISNKEERNSKEENVKRPFKTEPGTSFYISVDEDKSFDENKAAESESTVDNDEDKLFCLSLVPSFKKMTEKQKYDARIGIMQVLSDVRFGNTDEQAII